MIDRIDNKAIRPAPRPEAVAPVRCPQCGTTYYVPAHVRIAGDPCPPCREVKSRG